MQLDRTQIVIRERGLGEILDLALRVDRQRSSIIGPDVAGRGLALRPVQRMGLTADDEAVGGYRRQVVIYVVLSVLLVFTEMPWALLGVTAYVGQSMFDDEPRLSQVSSRCDRHFFPAAGGWDSSEGPVPVAGLVALSVRPGPLQAALRRAADGAWSVPSRVVRDPSPLLAGDHCLGATAAAIAIAPRK